MPIRSDLAVNGRNLALLAETTITTAVTGVVTTPEVSLIGMKYLAVQALFVYGSSGTNLKCWIQTSFDRGTTWTDVMNFFFETTTASKFQVVKSPTAVAANQAIQDAALANNTILDGCLGDRLRIKYTSTGTFAGSTTIKLDGIAKG